MDKAAKPNRKKMAKSSLENLRIRQARRLDKPGRTTLNLSESARCKIKALGDGNSSAGTEKAIAQLELLTKVMSLGCWVGTERCQLDDLNYSHRLEMQLQLPDGETLSAFGGGFSAESVKESLFRYAGTLHPTATTTFVPFITSWQIEREERLRLFEQEEVAELEAIEGEPLRSPQEVLASAPDIPGITWGLYPQHVRLTSASSDLACTLDD